VEETETRILCLIYFSRESCRFRDNEIKVNERARIVMPYVNFLTSFNIRPLLSGIDMINVENSLTFQQTLQFSSLGLVSLGWGIGSSCTDLAVDFQAPQRY
jgi:hypothetical protein